MVRLSISELVLCSLYVYGGKELLTDVPVVGLLTIATGRRGSLSGRDRNAALLQLFASIVLEYFFIMLCRK